MAKHSNTLFASGTLLEHLARGVAGFSALVVALALGQPGNAWPLVLLALLLGGAALLAFRGCPVCWTIGLFETSRQPTRVEACDLESRTISLDQLRGA